VSKAACVVRSTGSVPPDPLSLISFPPPPPLPSRSRATSLLRRVGMGERLDHVPSQMSGGEQQRVTIARALANRPALLLLDEPTGDLDTVNAHLVMKLLTDLNREENVACVLVTHDVTLKAYAHRVVHMLDGKISRVETVPSFVRDDALDALAATPAVRAWAALERQAAEGGGGGGGGGGAATTGGGGGLVSLAATLVGRVTSTVSGLAARVRGYAAEEEGEGEEATTPDEGGGKRGAAAGRTTKPAAGSVASASSVSAAPLSSVVVGAPSSASAAVAAASSVHTTQTGLAGVAAISHSIFAGDGAHASAARRQGGPVPTVVRDPSRAYATHSFAVRARAHAEQEEAERREGEARKEATLRKRVQAAAEARRRQLEDGAAVVAAQ
jgi:energy-coupling factor transporter ATP-binding protein EcfA2